MVHFVPLNHLFVCFIHTHTHTHIYIYIYIYTHTHTDEGIKTETLLVNNSINKILTRPCFFSISYIYFQFFLICVFYLNLITETNSNLEAGKQGHNDKVVVLFKCHFHKV